MHKEKTLADLHAGIYHIEVKNPWHCESHYLVVEPATRKILQVLPSGQMSEYCYNYPISAFKCVSKLNSCGSFLEIDP